MPSYTEHEFQADSNILFVKHLVEEKSFYDWAVTGCFYSAVHIVEAMIHFAPEISYEREGKILKANVNHTDDLKRLVPPKGIIPDSNHVLRKRVISSSTDIFTYDFYNAYKDLEAFSHASRYQCYSKCHKKITLAVKRLNYIVEQFNLKCKTKLHTI